MDRRLEIPCEEGEEEEEEEKGGEEEREEKEAEECALLDFSLLGCEEETRLMVFR
jgi:hypothetical protein